MGFPSTSTSGLDVRWAAIQSYDGGADMRTASAGPVRGAPWNPSAGLYWPSAIFTSAVRGAPLHVVVIW